MSTNDQESEILKKKIQKLLQENSGLADEVRNAQENVRLSNAQQSKAFQELTEYKKRIEQNDAENEGIRRKMQGLVQENQSLGEEIRGAQENLRLSANTIAKLNNEINDYKGRLTQNNQESETYRQKIQKLMQENTSLGDEVRNVQENLRLSAGTIAKLNNELKITCNELEDSKRKIAELVIVLQKKNEEVNNLNGQLHEMSGMTATINTLQERIQRLVGENKGMESEVREAQENLRLSAQQNQKIIK